MKKRILSIILALSLMFSLAAVTGITASAETLTSGDYDYYLNSYGTVVLSAYKGADSEIAVPSEIDGKPVTSVGKAFYNNQELKSITLPDSVTSIDQNAFSECMSLTDVHIGRGVTAINERAFYNCWSLETIEIPDNVISIGNGAFKETALFNNEANWENDVLYIGDCLISATHSRYNEDTQETETIAPTGSYTVKDGTRLIADYAFFGCESLTGVTLPDSVECIGEYAFDDTPIYNDSANWENGVLYIDNYLISAKHEVLKENTDEHEVVSEVEGDYTVKDGTKAIADNAFFTCELLTGITIPDSVINMGIGTFGSSSLKTAEIGNGVTSIGTAAFSFCTKLTDVTIGSSITSIGQGAFTNCYLLTNITIPEGVTSIGAIAFDTCKSLKEITLPDSITYFGNYALGYQFNYISWSYTKINGMHINCYPDTAGEQYAIDNGFDYTLLTADFGDANCDGNIDMLDVLLIRKYIAKQPVALDTVIADVTCDDNVDMLDVLLIRKYIAKQPVHLGPQE